MKKIIYMGNTFNTTALIRRIEELKKNPPKYTIGVDTYDEHALAYCLVRDVGGVKEVINCKKMSVRAEFDEEVNNLSRYFNAEIIGETPPTAE